MVSGSDRLLLVTLGLEYSPDELHHELRAGAGPGVVDAIVNFTPGLVAGLVLGWQPAAAVLLGGVCWVSSSGVVAKVLADLDRVGNRETPAALNLLVIEDLAMAVYLPVIGAVIAGSGPGDTVVVAISLAAVAVILTIALRWGDRLSSLLVPASDEALLLAVFGLTLLISGLAEEVQVSAAIGAFLVGLALSGSVQARAAAVVGPLRDLLATFFLFFSFSVDPSDLVGVLAPAALLAAFGIAGKLVSGWVAARPLAAGVPGRLRAGSLRARSGGMPFSFGRKYVPIVLLPFAPAIVGEHERRPPHFDGGRSASRNNPRRNHRAAEPGNPQNAGSRRR